jgi:hypothetical protein
MEISLTIQENSIIGIGDGQLQYQLVKANQAAALAFAIRALVPAIIFSSS